MLELSQRRPDGSFRKDYYGSDGKQKKTLEYRFWDSMRYRVRSDRFHKNKPTYLKCQMSTMFEDYDLFVLWCRDQPFFQEEGYQLDKDILKPRNLLYSEDLWVFVPNRLNSFFKTRVNGTDPELPTGTSFNSKEGCYHTYGTDENSKRVFLGRFEDELSSAKAYLKHKKMIAVKLAKMYRGLVDDRVITTLLNYEPTAYLACFDKYNKEDI